jgi:Clostripain family
LANLVGVLSDNSPMSDLTKKLRIFSANSALTSLLGACLVLTTPLGCSDSGGEEESQPSKPSKPSNNDDDETEGDTSGEDSEPTDDTDDGGAGDDDTDEGQTSGEQTDDDTSGGNQADSGPGATPVDPNDLPPVGADAEDSWTILVYMNGDNDLEHFSLVDFVEMVEVPTNADVRVLVQLDRAEDGPSPGYSSEELGPAGNFTSTKRFEISGENTEIIEDLGEVNMGEAETLADFVEWGLSRSKTGHYGLVFWDHGGGWDLFGPDDSANHDGLELPEIATGVGNGLEAAERDVKLDFIGFDACLMATLETAQAVRPYASLLLASQELEPGTGWDWSALGVLTADPSRSAIDIGGEFIDRYGPHVGETRNATLSLVDLDKLGTVTDAVAELADKLSEVNPQLVGQVRAQTPEFAAGHGKDLVDLHQFAGDLGDADASLRDAVAAVQGALDEVVVSDYRGPDASYSHGLSVYFPASPQSYNAAYTKLTGIREWQDYLTTYLDAGEELPSLSGFTDPDKIGQLTYDDASGLLYITGNLAEGTAEQIVSATLSFGLAIEDVLVFLGQNDGAWNADQAQGAWDLTALVGTQGDVTAPFYYYEQYSSDSGTYTFTTPVLYDGAYLLYYVLVLDSQFQLVSESYFGEIEGAIGEVQVGDSGTLQPILLAMDGSGEVTQLPLDTVFDLSAGDISFSFETLEPGNTVLMALEISDFGGNTDMVYNIADL